MPRNIINIPAVYQMRTIFWHKIWRGVVLPSAAPIQTNQPTGGRPNTHLSFFCRTNRHLVAFTKLFTRTDESSGNVRCPIRFMPWRAKTWEEMRRVPVPISKHSQTAIFVDKSVSFAEKHRHWKFHLTWARGTQFGKDPLLAVHLSESVSPFARNVRPWQHIYSTAQGSNIIVQFVS